MVTLCQIETWYDECIGKVRTLDKLFENPEALHAALDSAAEEKPAFQIMPPHVNILAGGYYRSDGGISTICIKNADPAAAKMRTHHETIHHILVTYAAARGRWLTGMTDISDKKAWKKELELNEKLTKDLTEIAIQDDENALFSAFYAQRFPTQTVLGVGISLCAAIGTAYLLNIFNVIPSYIFVLSNALLALCGCAALTYINTKHTRQAQAAPLPEITHKI